MKQKNSFQIFRIILSVIVFLFFVFTPLSADYSVNTSRGEMNIVVPEGYSIEDSFKEMAVLYLEEKWDHEELIKKSENLLSDIEKYKEDISDLEKLNGESINKRDELVDLYEEKAKTPFFTPKLGFGIGMDTDQELMIDTLVGVSILEKIDIYTKIGYPFSIGFQIGVSL